MTPPTDLLQALAEAVLAADEEGDTETGNALIEIYADVEGML